MPTIHRLPDCRIVINPNDHNPPHVHVRLNDGREALVLISAGTVIADDVRAGEIVTALLWIAANADTLVAQFVELQQ